MSSPLYEFTLLEEKQSSYSRIELVVVILHFCTFIILALAKYSRETGIAFLGMIAVVVYFLLSFLNKKKKFHPILLEVPVFLFALFWLIAGVYWMGILVFVFGSFSIISKQKIKVLFTDEEVLYKSLPKRIFKWDNLNNVILKDGMLTIDFKKNTIIQQLVEERDIDEAAFNRFCTFQLQSPKP
jgi:hypothetical protein